LLKFIHITDTHLPPDDARLYGIPPWDRLNACFRHIKSFHEDAAFVAITGDIAEDGSRAVYRRLNRIAKDAGLKVLVAAGNHDNVSNMSAELPAFSGGLEDLPPGAWAPAIVSSPAGVCLFLDTTTPNAGHGSFDHSRARDLERRLSRCQGRDIFLFMHHPPFRVGVPFVDVVRLLNPEPLYAVLDKFKPNIRHIFLGHLHTAVNGAWRGLPFSVIRSTAHQISARITLAGAEEAAGAGCDETPEYAAVIIDKDKVICNTARFVENVSTFPMH
jgi:3',5'-cyclic AMP phosphodiesterase CpdA